MPREQFDKKITTANPITEPKVIAQLEAIFRNIDTYRPVSEWSEDERETYLLHDLIEPTPNPWATLGEWAIIAFGIPLAVLVSEHPWCGPSPGSLPNGPECRA